MRKDKKVTKFLTTFLLLFLVVVLIGGIAVWEKFGLSSNKADSGNFNTWEPMSWQGCSSFEGEYVWDDGVRNYYSRGSSQYVLDPGNHTWVEMTWNGLTDFFGSYVWNDGFSYYYSRGSEQYILDVKSHTWLPITWGGYEKIYGNSIFVINGEYLYHNDSTSFEFYKLSSLNRIWVLVDFPGIEESFNGRLVWSDGVSYYYSNGYTQYILDLDNGLWVKIKFENFKGIAGYYVWKYKGNVYCSYVDKHYVFDVNSKQWVPVEWNGLIIFSGDDIWTDLSGNCYYSCGIDQYVLAAR